ncbi:MAG TPA: elongation factor G [Candidatus Methanoperedens sp.]|nr:elongation factor G [Candidatus Methanoperedens sp.]
MKRYEVGQLRNVVLLGGSRAGKTSLGEALLFHAGATTRLGSVDEGNSVLDFDPDEIGRKLTLNTTLASYETARGKVNLLDTPGFPLFLGDSTAACRVADAALFVVSAATGIKFESEALWKAAGEQGLPRLIVVTKLDRERSSLARVLEDSERFLGVKPVPLQVPIGAETSFCGVVDLLQGAAHLFPAEPGGKETIAEVPADLAEEVRSARERLAEGVAESDDALLEKYLDGQTLSDEEIRGGLRAGVLAGKLVPLVFAVPVKNWGTPAVADLLFALLPSPAERPAVVGENPAGQEEQRAAAEEAPFAALVFKTLVDPYTGKITLFRVFSGRLHGDQLFNATRGVRERAGSLNQVLGKALKAVPEVGPGDFAAVVKLKETHTGDTLCDEKHPVVLPPIVFPTPVMSMAVEPKSKGDEDRLSTALHRVTEADALIRISRDPQTKEMLISAMGQQHIEIVVERMKRLGVDVLLKEPKVPYRETVSKSYETMYRHKKQTGGAGQFAEVHLRVEPLPRGGGFEYAWEVFGGAISTSFRPSVEKGIHSVLEQGVMAGYPVVDVKAAVTDGKEHPVDSKDIAFQVAGREAFKLAVQGAGPKLLEPIMSLEIMIPEEFVGDIIGDLNSRRGRIAGVEGGGGRQRVSAKAPLAELLRYATDLTSMTGGRGQFTMELDHYEEVPGQIAEKIIAASRKAAEEEK